MRCPHCKNEIKKKISVCIRNNPYTFAKTKLSPTFKRIEGYIKTSDKDAEINNKRFERIRNWEENTTFTIKEIKASGRLGEEERLTLNYCVCAGFYEKKQILKKNSDEELEKEFNYVEIFNKKNVGKCPYLQYFTQKNGNKKVICTLKKEDFFIKGELKDE